MENGFTGIVLYILLLALFGFCGLTLLLHYGIGLAPANAGEIAGIAVIVAALINLGMAFYLFRKRG